MTEREKQKKATENGILVFIIVGFLMMMSGCCTTPSGDLTPENDCPLIQAGFATIDQLPKILK